MLAVAGGVVAWNLTGEIAFASASNRASDRFDREHPRRRSPGWTRSTGGAPALYIGQQMNPDQNGEWLLEFWNRSIKAVWSLDGTAQGPGPMLNAGSASPADGALSHDPGYPYVVEESGIDVVGKDGRAHTITWPAGTSALAPGEGRSAAAAARVGDG